MATVAEIADRLQAALAIGGETYAQALYEVWSVRAIDVAHEPALPRDGPMSREQMLAERRTIDRTFRGAMADFHYDDIYCRTVGDVIYLFCDQVGTLSDGTRIKSPLCTRLTIKEGVVEKVVMAIDPASVAPLQRAFAAAADPAEPR